MPIRRNYRRRPRRRTYRRRRGMSYRTMQRNVKWLKQNVQAEMKKHEVDLAQNPDSSGQIVSLTNIAGGTDENQRDGNEIRIKYLNANLVFTANSTATTTILRVIIFTWRWSDGADPSVSDILEDATDVNSFYDMSRSGNRRTRQFTVYYDRRMDLSDKFGGQRQTIGKLRKKLALPIKYLGNSGSDAAAGTNSIYILMLSNEAVNTPTVAGKVRVSFIDN